MEQRESSEGANVNDNEDDFRPAESFPFVTTSDVLNHLNNNLKELTMPSEEYLKPHFELQKRLPDGSTIPASESDLSASDLQNKVQQSAKFVSQLRPKDRLRWAEQQRQSGNILFGCGEYKSAMDIYLTCLVVKPDHSASDSTESNFLTKTLLPVLNNLAQCTLQLGMHKKTIEFCNIALKEISTFDSTKGQIDSLAICKVYFKRGKAQRLTGHYSEAREDLNQSRQNLEKEKQQDPDNSIDSFQQAIRKEFRHLEAAEKEARKNKQRQKRAMQKVLSSASNNKSNNSEPTVPKTANHSTAPLYDSSRKGPRQFSTLRSRKKYLVPKVAGNDKNITAEHLSYWQYYWLVVARVTEALLILLGDTETAEKVKEEGKKEAREKNR
jgi:hypothetical protein